MTTPAEPARDRFLAAFERSLAQQRFDKLLLSGYRGSEPGLRRLSLRLIELRGQAHFSCVFSHDTRDITKNLPQAEGIDALRGWLDAGFANAHLWTGGEEIQLAISRKGRASLRVGRRAGPAESAEAAAPPAHNREKARMLSLDRPFLAALGVADAAGRLVSAMARKWKQINRFLEVIDAALEASPLAKQQRIEIVDFGSGKAYLSFALHDHLRHRRGIDAMLTGVELRADMVELCNGIARRLKLEGLHFEQGDVSSAAPQRCDMLIALHACDTATDDAMHLGIRGGASIICCAPCCHKQLRPQLLAPHPLRPILQHGVHLGQEAEMLTDGLRALLLEACGYDTQIFEFVSLEHTAKNKMILAVKRMPARANTGALDQVREIQAFYGIREQRLEALLAADELLPQPGSSPRAS